MGCAMWCACFSGSHSTWRAIAASVPGAQSLLYLVLFPATPEEPTILPDQIADCSSLPLFSAVHWLALLCEPATLADRLRRRPAWRGWNETNIAEQLQFADWLRIHGHHAFDPP